MTTASFAKLANVTASTKRNPAPDVNNKIGAPVTYLTDLKITPLAPVSAEVAQTLNLNSPREGKVTYTDGNPDVKEGDVLVVSGAEYRIKAVGEWPSDIAVLEIFVEQVKGG